MRTFVYYTIPSKEKGLRIQTSDIVLGEPGVGKGQAFQWRDDLIDDVKKVLLKYADDELRKHLQLPEDAEPQNDPPPARIRRKFKYVDGVEILSDMPLPFLVDLPNGSAEAVFVIASKNGSAGMVPILE